MRTNTFTIDRDIDDTAEVTLSEGDSVLAADIQHLVVATSSGSLASTGFDLRVNDGMGDSDLDHTFKFAAWRGIRVAACALPVSSCPGGIRVCTGLNSCFAIYPCPPIMPGAGAGWGGRIRTYGTRYQKPLPYHLATPQRWGAT